MPQPNAQMQAVLDELQKLGPKPLPTLSPEEARRQPTPADAVKAVVASQHLTPTPQPVANVEDRKIPGPAGAGDVAVRVYTPDGTGPFPVVVYIHGGGWVIADLDVYDSSPRALANAVPAVVVSVEYRKAPEHPFPASVQDVHAAWRWTVMHAAEINGDPTRIAIAGESAGGNMATVVAMMARDNGEQMPVHQLLVYPVTDFKTNTPSYMEYADAKPLNRDMMIWFADQVIPNLADRTNPYAAPLYGDLADMPPATVILAEIDPLRSEGEAYVERLRAAGVPVRATLFKGVTHEFFGMAAVLDASKEAIAEAAEELRASFGVGATGAVLGSARSAAISGAVPAAVGDAVVGSDSALIGLVKEVRPSDVLVDRRLARDIYVPLEAIADISGGQVILSITADDVDGMGWANP